MKFKATLGYLDPLSEIQPTERNKKHHKEICYLVDDDDGDDKYRASTNKTSLRSQMSLMRISFRGSYYIGYFSVVMIKQCDQELLMEERAYWGLWFQRDKSSLWQEAQKQAGVAAGAGS